MRVLVVGGAGQVGEMVLPHLAEQHELRVFDLRPPGAGPWAYRQGSVTDYAGLVEAVQDMAAVVYLACGPLRSWDHPATVGQHFDVNVKGLYLTLTAAQEAGVRHAVLTSSMSVYQQAVPTAPAPAEQDPPDAVDMYGLTKRLGEEVCRAAVARARQPGGGPGLSVVALRLCLPVPDQDWPPTGSLRTRTIATSGRDTARAILAGLDRRGHGFEAFTISGDAAGWIMRIDRARKLLRWEPQDPTDGVPQGETLSS